MSKLSLDQLMSGAYEEPVGFNRIGEDGELKPTTGEKIANVLKYFVRRTNIPLGVVLGVLVHDQFVANTLVNSIPRREGPSVLPTLMVLPTVAIPTVTPLPTETPAPTATSTPEASSTPEGFVIRTETGCHFVFGKDKEALFDGKEIGVEVSENPNGRFVMVYKNGGIDIDTKGSSIRIYPYVGRKLNSDGTVVRVLTNPTMLPFTCTP